MYICLKTSSAAFVVESWRNCLGIDACKIFEIWSLRENQNLRYQELRISYMIFFKCKFWLGLVLSASTTFMTISFASAQTCRTDSLGVTRCDNGQTFRTDSLGVTRDNSGNSWRTDSLGVTRDNSGNSWRTDSLGVTRDNSGNSWRTDSLGVTRGSNGTSCRTDFLGVTRCY